MKNPLSQNEFKIMELLWNEGRSLSRPEIIERTPDRNWNPNSIHLILNNMIDKGAITIDGLTRCGRGHGRTYAPTMSRIDYAVDQLEQTTDAMAPDQRVLALMGKLLERYQLSDQTLAELKALLEK